MVLRRILRVDRQLDFLGVGTHEIEIELDSGLAFPVRLVREHPKRPAGPHLGRLDGPTPSAGGGDLCSLDLSALVGAGRPSRGSPKHEFDGAVRSDADIVVRPLHDVRLAGCPIRNQPAVGDVPFTDLIQFQCAQGRGLGRFRGIVRLTSHGRCGNGSPGCAGQGQAMIRTPTTSVSPLYPNRTRRCICFERSG